jgi:hypothetical protein
MRGRILLSFVLLLGFYREVAAQDVVSASSGVLQYFEGKVVLDGKPIEHKAAVFPSLNNGSSISTEKGRAELLLTPGVYLRLDENSGARMISNSLSDTRLELTQGSAILDNFNASPSDAIVLIYEGSEVRFATPGIYRMDSDVGELQAYSGDATVTHHGVRTTVDSSHRYYFGLELTTGKTGDGMTDEFYDWASNRSNVIGDQTQMAAADQADAQNPDPGGSAGMFVIPPAFTTPGISSPVYPSYGSTYSPLYLYSSTFYPGFTSFSSIIVFPPRRYRPGGSQWPAGVGTIYRPPVLRWPPTTQGSLYHLPTTALRNPAATSLARPAATAAPHVSIATPHVGAIGHR